MGRTGLTPYSVGDFQDEGLTAATMLWLAAEFGLPAPGIEADYVPDLGRYVVQWPTGNGE